MLRSSNPILSKQDAFTPAAPQYGQGQFQPYPQPGYAPQGGPQDPRVPGDTLARMSFDDVVTKTAVVMATEFGRTAHPNGSGGEQKRDGESG